MPCSVDRIAPDSVNWKETAKMSDIERLQLAFNLAEEHAGIPQVRSGRLKRVHHRAVILSRALNNMNI